MNVFIWITLVLAAMIGGLLFTAIGALLLALLLGNVSDRLARTDENHRDY